MIETMNTTRNKAFLATERGEPERSGGEPNGVAQNVASSATPDPEVLARPVLPQLEMDKSFKVAILYVYF